MMFSLDPQTAASWLQVIERGGMLAVLLGILVGVSWGYIWFWPSVRLLLEQYRVLNADYMSLAKSAIEQQQERAKGRK